MSFIKVAKYGLCPLCSCGVWEDHYHLPPDNHIVWVMPFSPTEIMHAEEDHGTLFTTKIEPRKLVYIESPQEQVKRIVGELERQGYVLVSKQEALIKKKGFMGRLKYVLGL